MNKMKFDYLIQEIKYKCNHCNTISSKHIAANYELVCFEDELENVYFLPTYGEHGYLKLLKKLIPEWNDKMPITPEISKKFIEELKKITPEPICDFQTIKCPKCKGVNVTAIERKDFLSCALNWLHISV